MKLKICLLFIFMLSGLVSAQNLRCYYCGKSIKTSYTTVDGHTYHPEHFLCAICRNPINGSFTKDSGKYYHLECFRDNKLEKCAVCGKPIEGEYYIDTFRNKYHAEHEQEYSKCSNCGRIICQALTNGGKSYGDSRYMCNICFKDAVFADNDFNRLLKKVMGSLKYIGLDFSGEKIDIQGVNLYELKRLVGSRGSGDDLRGFCKSDKTTQSNGRSSKSSVTDKIYVLNGMPVVATEQVIAHELMHAWIFKNTGREPDDSENEGICNYISYLYLRSSGEANVPFYIRKLEENPDPVYGKGFREMKDKYESRPLSSLLDYLRKF